MGMAASQARFLTLTARKSNVEYEGQQVNQQRTSLANESAGLFNKMMALQVPTPPSATDFYNTRYTFSSQSTDYSIYDFQPNNDGTYRISINYETNVDVARYYGVNLTVNRDADNNPKSVTLVGQTTSIPLEKMIKATIDGKEGYYLVDEHDQPMGSPITDMDYVTKASNSTCDTFYRYTSNDIAYYVSADNLEDYSKDPGAGQLATYYMSTRQDIAKVNGTATFPTSTEEGRFEQLVISNIESDDPRLQSDLVNQVFDLSLTQVQDDEGYAEAMKDYESQKMLYERTINDINAQTEVIQQQDRTLELRLKQLDTEQNALNTELEAVKKVIETNVEATFKTFA